MFQLITGRAGSGKSEYCMRLVERRAKAGAHSVIVVPEQSSFALERALTLRLGAKRAAYAQVKSFRSLCGDIFTECGGGARKRIKDAVRASLVRRAVSSLSGDIVCFKRHKRDLSFFKLAASVIDELKNAGVAPEALAGIAANAPLPLMQAKLRELSQIYARYEELLHTKYYDAASELAAAAQLCKNSRQFADKALLFDGFTGFTEPQFTMLGFLMPAAREVYVTLCCDDASTREHGVFATVCKNARRLLSVAETAQVDIRDMVVLDGEHRFTQAGLANLERFFAGRQTTNANAGVYKITGYDLYDEVRRAADEIVALVREHGYTYADIVVTVRDLEAYRTAVVRTFEQFGIPYFCDANRNMLYAPVMIYILAALDMANGARTEAVLQLLKTSLTALDDDTVSELENYLYVWNIDRAAWYQPFTENPNGLDAPMDEQARAALARVEAARKQVINWLYPVTEAARQKDGGELVKAVYEMLQRSGVLRNLEQADETTAREASIALELLDELYTIVEGEALSVSELRETARLLASTTAVGDIPPTLEQVSVGTADRMRTDNPKAVFVLGLNDGVFPRSAFDTPLLTGSERDLLAQHGADLTRNYENSAAMEELYLYRALTCATHRVYLCYAAHNQRGAALLPSGRVGAFLSLYGANGPESAADLARFVVNPATAMQAYATAAEREDGGALAALRASAYGDTLRTVDRMAAQPDYRIADATLPHRLLGSDTALSASRIETFSQCRFQYFLRYIMNIKPLKKAEMNPIAAGKFVHGVIENAMRALGAGLREADREQMVRVIDQTAAAYVERAMGEAAAQPRIAYLIERLKAQSLRLLLQLQSEQANSDFRPCDFELNIGDGGVRPLELYTQTGERIRVIGKVDRVDVYEHDDKRYIRVVDYKTGAKQFKLRDVYYGLQVQMLLYLFTIAQNGAGNYADAVPAAVMYMPADPSVPAESDDPDKDAKKAYRMDGLVLHDPDIIEAMEHGVNGVFIPVKYDKKGNLKSDKLASLERLGAIRTHIENTVVDMAQALYAGDIAACPIVDGGRSACEWCDYGAVCRRDRVETERVLDKIKESELFAAPAGGDAYGD